jgi:hypothetical protein
MEKTRTVFGDSFCLEFQTIKKEIQEFLDPQISQTNNILHVKVQESETEFVSMQIYEKLSTTATVNKDTYIVMKSSFSDEIFERGVKMFEAEESFKFMIIEVDSDNNLVQKYKSQLENILQNSMDAKLLVLVTDVNSNISFSNTNCSELQVDPVNLKDLSATSIKKVLSHPVEFQKFTTTWKDISEEDYLKNEILLKDILK